MNDYIKYGLIGALVVVVIALWRQGALKRLGDYVMETREELRKCSWPSVDELKGSTVVVLISIALLGIFTVGIDLVLTLLFRFVTTQI
ncbi:MAG TPA: preprotein translocase subunit SecE [Verrucomicrobiae bacterium]|nr:preprotein translocase subunit SecE [Verrucomicrobiae bacterium]